uniref:Si:ch211-171h4.3 n=1 Tax=Cynoglossus semilaevis TaxID=244447 RepID=A0A3P8W3C9_CYNSE
EPGSRREESEQRRDTGQDGGTVYEATKLLDELCLLSAQSLPLMDTSEHFQVLKLLGEGSYGRVMLVLHRKNGSPMALKFFPRESTRLLSFLQEYNFSLSFCSHPSLTRALGIVYSTPSHYIFAQQASLFGDLYDLIQPEVGLEEELCQRVVSQLCGALSHLHSLGFVHRDVKPENIFLCDATCHWVKLGDFGKVSSRSGVFLGSTVPEVWYSSPYCPPEAEVARGNQDIEPGTDSWALGILTYAMLTGTHPWAETSSVDPVEGAVVKKRMAAAPQFTCFTPLACSFFQSLLDPRPHIRGGPEDVLRFLGGDWLMEKEKMRLEKERKRKQKQHSEGI